MSALESSPAITLETQEQTQTILALVQDSVARSLLDLWERFVTFVPVLIGAVLVFVIGWIIAVAIGNLVTRILKAIHVNDAFERIAGLRSGLHRAGLELNVSGFIGGLVRWFLIIVSLLAASDILGLQAVSKFFYDVIQYIPNIVVASLMVVIGVIAGSFAHRVVNASVATARFPHGRKAAALAKWSVYVFSSIAALSQLGVFQVIIQPALIGFFAMIAIAGGISFGLGGKEIAEKILAHLQKDISEHKS